MVEVREVLRPWLRVTTYERLRDWPRSIARKSVGTWRQRSELVWSGRVDRCSSQMSYWELWGAESPSELRSGPARPAMISRRRSLLFVLYAWLRLLIDLALASLRNHAPDQAELLVLRHQVRVLERHVKFVCWRQADRLVRAALARRELVRKKWATFARRPRRGRPSSPRSTGS